MRRQCLELIGTLLTAGLIASTSVPDSDDGQSVTVGASWLQRLRDDDAVDEVVHSLDDYDVQTTDTTTTTTPHRSDNTRNVSVPTI